MTASDYVPDPILRLHPKGVRRCRSATAPLADIENARHVVPISKSQGAQKLLGISLEGSVG